MTKQAKFSSDSNPVVEWKKLGLVYDASKHIQDWAKNSALTPTPIMRSNGEIRVFCGFRDAEGVSRIGYVDLDSDNPTRVINVSKHPVLDIGRDGCFDDNGLILGDVVEYNRKLYLFYVGFQLVSKVKFLAFSGLAISNDEGESFQRVSESPFLDRHSGANYISAIHTARHEDGKWKFWYAAGDTWEIIEGRIFPNYGIKYFETNDLASIPSERISCIPSSSEYYRVGRPRVYRNRDGYLMHYTCGNVSGDYFPRAAHSADGLKWRTEHTKFPIKLAEKGWDSRHLCYPTVLSLKDKALMFYNGNDMGWDGFGVAECRDKIAVDMFS